MKFKHIESGMCTHCGPFSGPTRHVCADGIQPIDVSPCFTPEQSRELLLDGRGSLRPDAHLGAVTDDAA